MIEKRQTERVLRSGNTNVLLIPKTELKTMGDKAFSVVAPKMWNVLPKDLRMNGHCLSFKKDLKAHYINEAYNN
jgi:hypothetical protein